MRSLYIIVFLIIATSFSDYVLAQIPPKNENFVGEKTRNLVAEIVELRSGLAIDSNPTVIPTLLEQVACGNAKTNCCDGCSLQQP